MSRRGIDEETLSVGIGCVGLDVEMAREHDWTKDDIDRTWEVIEAAYRATSQQVAKRKGHTRTCPDCECWTVPDGPCHLCERDRLTAEEHEAKPCRCSCGERFATLAELQAHAAASGGLLHGDTPTETLTPDDLEALQYLRVFAETAHEMTAYKLGIDPEHGAVAQRAIVALDKILKAASEIGD